MPIHQLGSKRAVRPLPIGGLMSGNKKFLGQFPRSTSLFTNRRDPKTFLKEILNFGPGESQPPNTEITERIKQLVRELEEINRRIDELSNRM